MCEYHLWERVAAGSLVCLICGVALHESTEGITPFPHTHQESKVEYPINTEQTVLGTASQASGAAGPIVYSLPHPDSDMGSGLMVF